MSQENLVQPGGCEQHPTAGRIGPYCMACTIIPTPPGMDVSELLSREASATPDRLTVDTINSDQLDALQLRAARMEHATKQAAELRVRLEDTEAGITAAIRQRKAAEERALRAEAERDGAYRERAQLLALLAALHPSVIAPAPDVDDDGWQILYLRIGGKQASWHIAPRDAELYAHVEHVPADDRRAQWDGHTTEQKYAHIGQRAARLYAEARGRVEIPADEQYRFATEWSDYYAGRRTALDEPKEH